MAKPKTAKPLDLRELLAILARRKWLIILPLVIITGVSYVSTYFLVPKYQSSTIVWIDKPSSVSRELMSIVGERRETRDELQSRRLALETEITSKNYLSQLISDLRLDDDPEVTRQAEKAKARESTPNYSLEQIRTNILVEKLREQISVSFHGWDQIKITVESPQPVLARDMADRLAYILEQEKAKYEMEKILDNQAFTNMQLQKAEYYYKAVLDSLNNTQARLSRLRGSANIATEANRAVIYSSLEKTRLERDDYIRERASLKTRMDQSNLRNVRLEYSDSIAELRRTIDGLISTYGNRMENYAGNEQSVIDVNIRLNNNISQLEQAIAVAVGRQFSSLPVDQQQQLSRYFVVQEHVDILRSKEERLQRPLDELDQRVVLIPRLESDIVELQSRVEDARVYRDAFRSEEKTAGILSEQVKDRTKYKVIEPAELPLEPFWPDKRKIILIGFVLGIALGGSFVFLTELFDNSFKRVEDVEDALGVQVLATIPRIEKLKALN
ncbi:MAG: hypothetical protein JSU74_01560 [Candidatus Zixiibacteriota bacterium]|nr:MAG: hypothetical protein JSU74_01560 [candidate division Zixibacteria bacterium]